MPADGAGYTENPLAHIGAKRWIIDLPEPGEAGPGALILNPDDADLQGYTMFPLQAEPVAGGGPNVTWQDRLPGCLNNLSTGQQICGPAILDTGSPLVMAFQAGATQSQLWSPGNNVSLSFATGGSAPLTVPFLADRYAGTGLGEGVPDGPRVLAAGEMSFFAFSVFFDANAGVIGLRPRADAPDMLNVPIPDADANSQIEVIQMNLPGGAPQAGAAPALPQVITPSP